MKTNNEWRMPKNVAYLLLFGIQIFGAMIFIWQDLSEFERYRHEAPTSRSRD